MLKRKLLVEVKIFIIWTKKNKEAENPLWFVEVSNGETVTLNGEVSSVLERNRVVVVTGNVSGISAVSDNLVLNIPEPIVTEPEKQYYTVVSGDYLSKI